MGLTDGPPISWSSARARQKRPDGGSSSWRPPLVGRQRSRDGGCVWPEVGRIIRTGGYLLYSCTSFLLFCLSWFGGCRGGDDLGLLPISPWGGLVAQIYGPPPGALGTVFLVRWRGSPLWPLWNPIAVDAAPAAGCAPKGPGGATDLIADRHKVWNALVQSSVDSLIQYGSA